MFPFHVTMHAVPFHVNTCSLYASFLSTNPTTRHCNNMFCFDVLFCHYSPTSNLCVSINFRLTSSLYNSFPSHHEESPPLFFGGPAASMFLFAIRLTSSLYVSFVFRSTSTTLSFHLFAAEQQPLCFLCFRLLTTSLYVSNSCSAIHAAFMFPLFRGIPPRRIVIIRFVLCLVLHYSPTSSVNVSNVFPSQQPLYVSNVFR